MIRFVSAIAATLLTVSTLLAADEALFTYKGDGLTIEVTEWSDETGAVAGVIKRGTDNWPFKGKVSTAAADTITGSFTASGSQHEFTSKINDATDSITFTTAGTTYNLKAVGELPDAGKEAPKPAPKPDNPLAGGIATGKPDAPTPTAINPTDNSAPAVLKLKQHVFNDISMGGVPAYTVLTPADWTASGNVEWQNVGEVPFPQCKFEIKSPAGGRIRYIPQMTVSYSNAPGMGQQGIPAPQNFPEWLRDAATQSNKNISNLKLIDAKRNTKLEEIYNQNDRKINALPGMEREAWVITFEYDEAGVHQREEFAVTYAKYPPFNGINGFFTQSWSMFTSQIVTGPADQFESMKKDLYNVVAAVRPTVGWFTQSQAVIAENSRRRSADIWRTILERGKQINQTSDADYQKYKKELSSDSAQHDRLNTIYERSDYKDTDGNVVNLPMHYKNVFSDGKGNYVLSNNSLDKPGELWTPIEPIN